MDGILITICCITNCLILGAEGGDLYLQASLFNSGLLKLVFNNSKPSLNTSMFSKRYLSLGGAEKKAQNPKEITVTDLKTNITSTYDSISKAAEGIDTSVKSLTQYINSSELEKLPYLDRYFLVSDKIITTIILNFEEIDNSDKLKIPKASWKRELGDQYRKHNLIVKFLKDGKEPNKEFLNELLSFPEPSLVTDAHLKLCEEIYSSRVVMPIPFPNTEHVVTLRNLVGGESYESKVKTAGCYILSGTKKVVSPITKLESLECYLGQSLHLGNRVKSHTKGGNTNSTWQFLNSIRDKGKLELCIVPDNLIPKGLTKTQFVTLLEQYLILKLKPTVNKKLLAKPGIVWTPEVIKNHSDKLSTTVYVYQRESDDMILVQVFPTTRSVGLSLDKGKSFFSNLITRTDGWYKDLFFTNVELEGAESRLMSIQEFTKVIEKASAERAGTSIRVIDVTTGEITDYTSMKAVTRALGIDNKGIKDKVESSKLYKNRFKFEVVES